MALWLEYRGHEYRIPANGLKIGRGTDNDLILSDKQASRHHAMVWEAQGVTYIRDQGSTNGTFVNQRRITSVVTLHPGDQIQIGRTALAVHAGNEGVVAQLQSAGVGMAPSLSRQSSSLGMVFAIGGIVLVTILVLAVALVFVSALGNTPTPTRIALPTSPSVATLAPTNPPVMTTPAPVVTPTNPRATQVTSAPPALDGIRRALLAVVYIESPVDGSNSAVSGSGSIVDARGYILTNYHVVRDIKTGKPYNSRDRIYVAVVSDPNKPPDRIFRAQVTAFDNKLDLALVKLIAMEDGSALPANLNLTPIVIGDSDRVQINEEIRVIGFPGIGGDTVTASRGIISGFLGNREWIKTDTELNPGNSGGAAIDVAGELIGIPTRVVSDRTVTGKLGYIRPINLAKGLVANIK